MRYTMLAELLGSKVRARIIAALLVAPGRRLHLRALVRAAGGSVASVQRELERLEDLGLVASAIDESGRRQVTLAEDHPFAALLEGMLAADPRAQYEARSATIPNLDPHVASALGDSVEAIVTGFDPIRIVLFGSQANGTAQWDSDIDLLVVLPEVKDPVEDAVALRCAIGGVGRGVDVVPTDQQGLERAKTRRISVIRDAAETGVTLYDRPV
jgi:predicted nucleotidyltransferase